MRRFALLALLPVLAVTIAAGPASPTAPAPGRFLTPTVFNGETVDVWAYARSTDPYGRTMIHWLPHENQHLFAMSPRTLPQPGLQREADGTLNNGLLLDDLHREKPGLVLSDNEGGEEFLRTLVDKLGAGVPVVNVRGEAVLKPGAIEDKPPASGGRVDLPLARTAPPTLDRRWYAVPAVLMLVGLAIAAGNRPARCPGKAMP